MSKDKIMTLYVCPVCHHGYEEKSAARICLQSHNNETLCAEISLLNHCVDGSFEYKFKYQRYRRGNEWPEMDTSVICEAEYKYPGFSIDCLDTEQEILAAKRKLLKAAHKWIEKYDEVLTKLERELEVEND